MFVGGFDAEAAMAVAPVLTLEVLGRLVDKSLVPVSESPSGRTRYRLLETVWEYARELLDEAGELDGARDRHIGHFSALAEPGVVGWPRASSGRAGSAPRPA